jgi:serine/threonine-protein kinase ULK4
LPHLGASPEFEDLVTRLLDKNPASRIGWAEMPGHGFWKAPLPPRDMPQEPLLEQFIAEHGLLPALPAEPASDRVHLSITLTAACVYSVPPRKIPNRDLVHP